LYKTHIISTAQYIPIYYHRARRHRSSITYYYYYYYCRIIIILYYIVYYYYYLLVRDDNVARRARSYSEPFRFRRLQRSLCTLYNIMCARLRHVLNLYCYLIHIIRVHIILLHNSETVRSSSDYLIKKSIGIFNDVKTRSFEDLR